MNLSLSHPELSGQGAHEVELFTADYGLHTQCPIGVPAILLEGTDVYLVCVPRASMTVHAA